MESVDILQTIAEVGIGLAGFSGLVWYLVHAAQQFMRMLFIQPKE